MSKELLYPESIAIIGASKTPGKVGYEVLANLKAAGFEGKLVPINPTTDTVQDLPCYPSLKEYPDPVDMCVIAVPATMAKDAVRQSISAGAKAIVIVTAGFKDAWARRDFSTITAVGKRLPDDAFVEDEALLYYYDNARRLAGP